ncbi:methyltransferase [Arthrobacter agilis]|uniref:class I SAM-dependent methyltransferase n=1 Tax=Arthrobacter agilis TaxID=37921 RepID=UPI000B34B6BE|nr:class I SAM-dependent methyltransferase [Arthrobacter agilis]OUM44554.1 SAM-dependent methyltransferase [Arthrobacter agilis]PPB47594.1 methyltransferase domain-containing protein [Arthrobacter agilis]TPV22751.1 methyltransferase [Arthrobacter agilis]
MERVTPLNLDLLRRRPDVEAPELVAVDAADRLLLDLAAEALRRPGRIVTLNDSYGALTLGAAAASGREVRAFQDGLVNERALAANAADLHLAGAYRSCALGPELFDGVTTVLMRLPRSLDELDEQARLISAHAQPDVQVLAAGRLKHMSVSMNAVLARSFGSVTASLARQKSRVLVAAEPHPVTASSGPSTARYDVGLERPLELHAFAATFGGASLDPGTRLLLPHLRGIEQRPAGSAGRNADIVDLGCGNGAIATYLALGRPDVRIHATDQSASAVASTRATALANGVADRVAVDRDDALSAVPDASAQVIVLNPPFHIGSTVHEGTAHRLFDACARVLAPGGELWTVWNSHLRYRPVLERTIGPTRQLDRTSRFTVTVSTRR